MFNMTKGMEIKLTEANAGKAMCGTFIGVFNCHRAAPRSYIRLGNWVAQQANPNCGQSTETMHTAG